MGGGHRARDGSGVDGNGAIGDWGVVKRGEREDVGLAAAVGLAAGDAVLELRAADDFGHALGELLRGVDALAVDVGEAVAGMQAAVGRVAATDAFDDHAAGFFAGEADEAADRQPVDRVEGLAELFAADSGGQTDAELLDADAGEFGSDVVAQLVQDNEGEQDAYEGEDVGD